MGSQGDRPSSVVGSRGSRRLPLGTGVSLSKLLESDLWALLSEAASAHVQFVLANDPPPIAANSAPADALAAALRVGVPEVVCHSRGFIMAAD